MNANKPAGRLSIPKSFFMRIKNQLRLIWWRIENICNAKTFSVVVGISICCVLVILGLRMFDLWGNDLDMKFGTEVAGGDLSSKTLTIRMLGLTLFGLIGAFGLIVAYLRAQALFEANQAIFQANRDKVFTDAINHLGSDNSDSVRLGGIYGLYNLINLESKRLPNIVNILCAHLREATRQTAYQTAYKDKPSNEIQSLLDVLGKINTKSQNLDFTALNALGKIKRKHQNLNFAALNFGGKVNTKPQNADSTAPVFDLSDSYLCGADLMNINLSEAKLHKADLGRANLYRANLSQVILKETKLQGAYLRGADLQGASLRGVDLQKADLMGAKLQGAVLVRSDLRGVNFWDADLQRAYLIGVRLQGAILITASLQRAHLRNAYLQGEALSSPYLQGADLRGASLQGADLRGAGLQGADLRGAGLQDADLTGANLQGANLKGAYLQRATLIRSGLQGADLEGVGLQGADLRGASLQGADLTSTGLQGAYLGGAGLQGAFSPPKPDQVEKIWAFEDRMNKRRGKDTELTTTVFSGGVLANEFTGIAQNLIKSGVESVKINEIMECIRPHLGKKKSVQLPPNSGATTGVLTNEMAKQIIKYYKKAMQPVSICWGDDDDKWEKYR